MNEIENIIKAEAKVDISESTNKTLEALCFPAAEQAGKALGNIAGLINTITLPVKLANVWAERNFEKYAEKLKDIPSEKIKEVEPEIGIPLMEKLSYTSNNDLAEAYANLLAKASNKDDVDLIHPGFINKLNSMSPDEVRILEYLKDFKSISYIVFRVINEKDSRTQNLSYRLTGLESVLGLAPDRIQLHIENLISLSILRDRDDASLADVQKYEEIIDLYKDTKMKFEIKIANGEYGEDRELDIQKCFYEITTIGKVFINACTTSSVIKV